MKLSLSNICGHEIEGVPIEATYSTFSYVKKKGITPIACQSLLFDRPNLHVMDDHFLSEIQNRLMNIKDAGCNIAIFGSPKNRNYRHISETFGIEGKLDYLKNWAWYELDKFDFLIEQIPAVYGSNMFTHLPRDEDDPLRLNQHLDTTNLWESLKGTRSPSYTNYEQDFLYEIGNMDLSHVHLTAHRHRPLIYETEINYKKVLEVLKKKNYTGHVSLEMLPCSFAEAKESVELIQGML